MKVKCGAKECESIIVPFDKDGKLELFCKDCRGEKDVDISN